MYHSAMIESVHQANKEKHTGDFDICVEQAALSRMCRDETVQVLNILGPIALCASHRTVFCVPSGYVSQLFLNGGEAIPDTHVVIAWHGRVWNPTYKRHGEPFVYGPYENQFYNRDRVAEILAKHKESLK